MVKFYRCGGEIRNNFKVDSYRKDWGILGWAEYPIEFDWKSASILNLVKAKGCENSETERPQWRSFLIKWTQKRGSV